MTGVLCIPFMLHAQPDLVPISLTAPAEAVSEHQITAIEVLANGRIRVAFLTIGGLTYGLENSASLGAGSWQSQAFYAAPDSADSLTTTPGTGSEVSVYVVPTGDYRFYRAVAHYKVMASGARL